MPSYDPRAWRRSARQGRERGCHIYIPAEELLKLRADLGDRPPVYRITHVRTKEIYIEFHAPFEPADDA
jgi:hypothetical protein